TVFIPISVGDLLYLIAIVAVLRWLYRSVKHIIVAKEKFGAIAIKLLQAIGAVIAGIIVFNLSWALNYDRPSLATQLNIDTVRYNEDDLRDLTLFLSKKIQDLDSAGIKPMDSSHRSLTAQAVKDLDQLGKKYPAYAYKIASVKPAMSSWLISRLGVEGYYNPFTGEATVNRMLPSFVLPFTYAHEMAHQAGIGREDEASLLAYLAGKDSSDPATRYAANYAAITYVVFELARADFNSYEKIISKLPPRVQRDMKTERAFWKSYNSKLYDYMSATLDAYLKLNNQEKGIKSYNGVVLWIFNLHKNDI
ncbi:MAG: DUF3810 domain-containing protein, partial [Chitinophagaceae bacterium]